MSEEEKKSLAKFCEIAEKLEGNEKERLMSFINGFLYAKGVRLNG